MNDFFYIPPRSPSRLILRLCRALSSLVCSLLLTFMFQPRGPNFFLSWIMAWKKQIPNTSFRHVTPRTVKHKPQSNITQEPHVTHTSHRNAQKPQEAHTSYERPTRATRQPHKPQEAHASHTQATGHPLGRSLTRYN